MDSLSDFLTFSSSPSLNLFQKVQGEAIHVNGATIPMAAMMVATRFQKKPEHILVVAKDYRSAEVWVENLESMLGEEYVRFFPSVGLKPYEKKVPFEGVLEERLKFFRDLEMGDSVFVTVCPLDCFLMRLPAPGAITRNSRTLKVGDVLEPSTLRPWLMDHGFVEQPVVSGVGEFSIRGCIVDVNCLLYKHPIRIEFFGDEIESIRSFDIFSQRSVERMNSVQIYPMGEFVVPEKELAKFNGDNSGLWWYRDRYEKLEKTLLDYLPKAPLVFEELSALSETASKYFYSYENNYQEIRAIEPDIVPPGNIWAKMGELSRFFVGRGSLDVTRVQLNDGNGHDLNCRPQDFSSNGTDAVAKQIEEFAAMGGKVYVVSPTPGGLNRLKQVFSDLPIEEYLLGNLTEGFWLEEDNVAFLTETRIFNRHSNKTRKRKVSGSVTSALMVESLNRGDFVAHEDHGVGKYLGLVRVEAHYPHNLSDSFL